MGKTIMNPESYINKISKKADIIHKRMIRWKQALEFVSTHAHNTPPEVLKDVVDKALTYTE